MRANRGVSDSHTLPDGTVSRSMDTNGHATIPITSSASVSPPSSFSPARENFIEHRVSKMDTLAGVAIKYGVEVADIRRINGLVTDLQMFALKSLQIPMPGRHPPSPLMSNGSTQNGEKTPRHQSSDMVDTLRSLKLKPSPHRVSPAMCSLQGYYGLTKSKEGLLPEGTEMAVYKSGKTVLLEDDAVHSRYQMTRNLVNGLSVENVDAYEDMNELEGSIRRRQKAGGEPCLQTPEILLKEECSGAVFSGSRTGNGLALRTKPGNSRTEIDEGQISSDLLMGGDVSVSVSVSVLVRKSSSASNLAESDNVSSIWPVFDGLPKPITGWRNKTALD